VAQNKTEKSCYQSRFGSGWITGAQFLAENMCSRKSRAGFGGELPHKFWKDKYWEKQLQLQLLHANKLLKQFDISDILVALKHPDAKRLYSLGLHSVLNPLIERERNLRISREKQQENSKIDLVQWSEVEIDINQQPRKPFASHKSSLQKLRDLENG
jgi:hypothetical protein